MLVFLAQDISGAVGSIPGSQSCCLTSLQRNCCSEVFPIFDKCLCHLHQAAGGSLGTQPAPALALSRGKPHVEASPCHWAVEPHPCHSGSRESSSPPCLSFTRVQQDGHGTTVFPLFLGWEPGEATACSASLAHSGHHLDKTRGFKVMSLKARPMGHSSHWLSCSAIHLP